MSTDNERLKREAELKIEAAKKAAEEKKREAESKLEQDRIIKEKRTKSAKLMVKIAVPCIVLCLVVVLISIYVLIPMAKINNAISMMAEGEYAEAKVVLETVNGFGSEEKLAVINALPKFDTGNGNNTNFDLGIRAILDANEPINVKYNLAGGNALGDYFTYETPDAFTGLLLPTKEGYRFKGWSLEGYQYSKDENLTLNLVAIWTDGYTITYNLDGGTANNSTEYHKDGEAITLERPVREGYTFIGWTGTDLSAGTVDVTIPAGSYGDREYTAHWAPNEYTFTLDANGGKVEQTSVVYQYDSNYVLPVPTKEYYKFIGWYNGDVQYKDGEWPGAGDTKLTAKWEPIGYAIRYELNGGTNASYQKGSYTIESGEIKFDNPTRTGYKFMGWYADSSYKKKVTSIPEGSHGDVTIYAKWEIIEYTITYKLDGGKLSGTAVKKFTVNDLPVTLPTATKSGMIFLNWGNGSWDGNVVDKITVCGDVTVEASYLDNNLHLTLSNDGTYYLVSYYSGDASRVTIPAYYQGKPIKEIGGSSFIRNLLDDSNLVTVRLPATIKKIGGWAFQGNENLKNINIPYGVSCIEEATFKWCNALKKIDLPDSIISIEEDAFWGCAFESISLPIRLQSIGHTAYGYCEELRKVKIPVSVTKIDYMAFFGTDDVTFYCEAALQQKGWQDGWNNDGKIILGYTED